MKEKWRTRQSLLCRAKDPTDQQAWDEFVHYYKQFIHMILHQMNFRSPDFDDVEQELLVRIWKSLSNFEVDTDRAHFRTWLSRLIRNGVIDYIRKTTTYSSRRDKAVELYTHESELVPQSELDAIVEHEWVNYVTETALGNIRKLFSETAIRALELSLEGKSSHEIGNELGINHESVRTLKNRVKVRLVKEIELLREELEF